MKLSINNYLTDLCDYFNNVVYIFDFNQKNKIWQDF